MALSKIPANMVNTVGTLTKSASDPATNTNPSGGVGTVWLNTTTGETYCCTDATNNANVWKNIGDGTGNIPVSPLTAATGGTVTTDGDYKVHKFTSSGTFTVTTAGNVEYLVVAGGGGAGDWGGGGGGGGFRTATDFAVTAQAYNIVVGAGGSGQGNATA